MDGTVLQLLGVPPVKRWTLADRNRCRTGHFSRPEHNRSDDRSSRGRVEDRRHAADRLRINGSGHRWLRLPLLQSRLAD